MQKKRIIFLSNNMYGNSNLESMYVAAHEASHAVNNQNNQLKYKLVALSDKLARPTCYVALFTWFLWLIVRNQFILNTFFVLSIFTLLSCIVWCIMYYKDESGAIELSNVLITNYFTNFTGIVFPSEDMNAFNTRRISDMKINIFLIAIHGIIPISFYLLATN